MRRRAGGFKGYHPASGLRNSVLEGEKREHGDQGRHLLDSAGLLTNNRRQEGHCET
jgi:hypothetical protein